MSKPDLILYADGARGIYIPQFFAESIRRDRVSGVSEEDLNTLALGDTEENEYYWDTWADVLDHAIVTDDAGVQYTLWQDGDLWLVPVGMAFCDRHERYFWPMDSEHGPEIQLSQSDDDDGTVTVYCDDPCAAEHDQSIEGSSWEAPRDMDIAYATISDRIGLVVDLESQGYRVDASEYCEPGEDDLARWSER